jgi:hypothetical protein
MASLEIHLDKPGKLEGKIINGLGQVVKVVICETMEEGSHLLQIDGTGMAKGFYSLLFTFWNYNEMLVISKKMIIK